jgi:hypothetical protein
MKRRVLYPILMILLLASQSARGDEGMWLPLLMTEGHWEMMQHKGLRISPEEIYSVNSASLKDAVIHFGGGCTGMLVSAEGLMFTNHHCAYSRIQRHSSVEHDYLTDGFWAIDRGDELPNIGLTASILVRVEDVTTQILAAVNDTMNERDRAATIRIAGIRLIAEATRGTHFKAEVRPLYYGNQFILLITEVFRDVRLVGAPPSSIGKFGRDTDNWMWPRHTGDFAIFRIYAGPDNKPAEYDSINVPYRPRKFFEISAAGIEEGDFTMVYGFPGRTEQYLPSFAIRNYQHHTYPSIVRIRDHELAVINHTMSLSDELRIKYTARQASIANGWKLYRGVIPGLERFQVINKKEQEHQNLLTTLSSDREQHQHYQNILLEYERLYDHILPYQQYNTYFNECFWRNPMFRFIFRAYRIPEINLGDEEGRSQADEIVADIVQGIPGLYSAINPGTEQQILAEMIRLFVEATPHDRLPAILITAQQRYQHDYNRFAADLFAKSLFANEADAHRFFSGWNNRSQKRLLKDPLFHLMHNIVKQYMVEVHPNLQQMNRSIDSLHRLNMAVLLGVHTSEELYPDANSTLRIAYGYVAGSSPRDAVQYHHRTVLAGVMEKNQTGNPDYIIPEKLRHLEQQQYYHPYSTNGTMPVAFIANNHTTGGNSGSPVLNRDGHLIGINFDRAWEGTMSDLHFEPSVCRNISVDIRYLLFITDRLGGASHLLEEMVIHY